MPEREIIDEIGRFREKLLELSNRNPLLSYRKTKLKTLEFVGESPDQVYSRLVDEGKRFRFAPRPEEELFPSSSENGEAGAEESETSGSSPAVASSTQVRSESLYLSEDVSAETSVAEQQSDGLLQTSLSEARLETVLKHIRREANTAIEETGVNFLYLVVGMLAWREDANSERTLLAPLLLVPVEIDRDFDARSQRYRYAVKWREEEVQDNLCLLKRLEKDFGMRLPRFDQDQTPEQYFAEIERSVCSSNEWTVERSALIGFFSFQKLLMYLDIDPENWSQNGALEEGSIVHDLVWGTDENAGAPLYASDYEIDNHPVAHDVIFPLDADSSQHSALVDIQSGKSLVIEGPPGTGKSQTITNAIAAALHQGKNVLFVAEKLTALEVVREKLDRLGLADFCLELHSDAASPRLVYESLRRRLEHTYPEPARLEDLRAELERKQRQIGDYLQVTSQIVGPYKEPLYDLMWRVTNLRALRFSRLRDADVDTKVNQAVLNENAELLDAYAETLGELDAPKESPWWGCWLDNLNPNDTEWVDEVVAALREHAKQAEITASRFAERFGAKSLDWLDKRLQQPTNGSDLSSLVEASQKITREGDLRPLQQNLNRKLASQFEGQLRRLGELRIRADPLLTVELPEAAKASRAFCDALDAPVVAMLSGNSMGELMAALELLPALREMLGVDAAPTVRGGSREKLCRKLASRYETTLLKTIGTLNACGEEYAAATATLDSHCTAGIAEWFASRPDRQATINACGELEECWPQALNACDVRHFIAADTRSLARSFLQTATKHQNLKRQLAQKAFTSTEEAPAAAEAALAPLHERLSAIPVATNWGELKQLRVRLKTLEEVLGR